MLPPTCVVLQLSPLPRLCFDFRRRRIQEQQWQQEQEGDAHCTVSRHLRWPSMEDPNGKQQHAGSSPTGSEASARGQGSGQGSGEGPWYDCVEQLPSPKMRSAAAFAAGDAFAALAEAPASLGLGYLSQDMQGVAEVSRTGLIGTGLLV